MIAEERIRQAVEAGQFDKLPGFGQPLPEELFTAEENWWLIRSRVTVSDRWKIRP